MVVSETFQAEVLFFFSEPFGLGGIIGHEEEHQHAEDDSSTTSDESEDLPAVDGSRVLLGTAITTESQKGTEATCRSRSCTPPGHTRGMFVLLVPLGSDEKEPSRDACLENTHEDYTGGGQYV